MQRNALALACERGDLPMVRLLVEELGASIEGADRYRATPFIIASQWNPFSPNRPGTRSAVSGAGAPDLSVVDTRLEITRLLAQKGAAVDATDNSGSSAWHYACAFMNTELALCLVSIGVDKELKVGPSQLPEPDFEQYECRVPMITRRRARDGGGGEGGGLAH